MSERIDDPTFQDYSWTDDERSLYHANNGSSNSSTEPANVQQGKSGPQESSPTNNHATPTTSNPSITSYNGMMVDVRDNGGQHFQQNGKIYYKKGEKLYGAEQIPGGNYTVAEVPDSEAKGIIAKDILDNGKSLYARNRIYYLHGNTVYGFDQKADGSTEAYAVSPHEDADIYTVAHSKGRSMPTAEAPLIDPTDVIGAGLAKAGITASRTAGSLLNRAGAAAMVEARGQSKTSLRRHPSTLPTIRLKNGITINNRPFPASARGHSSLAEAQHPKKLTDMPTQLLHNIGTNRVRA